MLDIIYTIFKQRKILYHINEGITFCAVQDEQQGVTLAKDLLYGLVDAKTVLYLSGGKTPQKMYKELFHEGRLLPGAVGQIDERFGESYHTNSNQRMLKDTELLRYFALRDIPFYPILQSRTREETAELYDEKLRSLHAAFQRHVGILGIGVDGHTAGLPAQSSKFKISAAATPMADKQNSKVYDSYDLVTEYNDESGKYGERVTMTFLGLSMLDFLLVLVLGPEKKTAIELMFQNGSEQEIPARFYKRPEIARKTILITDQVL
jgi:6-phosphogluconolactonase/glucosamine-6-phosphate isomerase/deaminase